MNNENRSLTLEEEVTHLISLQQEGSYWDFKREWYKNKTNLLLDIICMANNLSNHDGYIIIGVDEENDYLIANVENDSNRRNTQNIVDFLKDKKFAGGIRPLVHVEQLTLNGVSIDVIVIENSHNTPFYLTDQFEGVRANNIYTRVMDTNTPIDKSADINNVEYLWRKRFRLDDTPIEKIKYYLQQPNNWAKSTINTDCVKYYIFSPEYVIKLEWDRARTGYEFYFFGQMNHEPSWLIITLNYYQTTLDQFICASLDGGRCLVVAPSLSRVSFTRIDSWDVSYRYYEENSLEYILTQFLRDENDEEYMYAYYKLMKCVLLFDSEIERKQFEEYVRQNESHYRDLYSAQGDTRLPYFPDIEGYNMDAFKTDYRNALAMQKMLEEFRKPCD